MKDPSVPQLLLADDHAMIRMAIRLTLQNDLNVQHITEAASCSELLGRLKNGTFTHLITDLMFKDGSALEMMPNIRALYPTLEIMVCSQLPSEIYLPVLERYSVKCYAEKTASESHIEDLLRRFIYPNKSQQQPKTAATRSNDLFATLSQRELEVLHYLLKGSKMVDIAALLNINQNTVYTLKSRIMEKTGALSLKELYELAKISRLIA